MLTVYSTQYGWFYKNCWFSRKQGFNPRKSCLWGHITLAMDTSGLEYLELHGMETKNITGEIFGVEEIRPRAWANLHNPARCPVEIFKIFRQKRHPTSLLPISPFFIAIKKRRGEYWYQNKSMGHNTLSSVLGEIGRRANLLGKKTVGSLQKTGRRPIPFVATFQAWNECSWQLAFLWIYEAFSFQKVFRKH